jgi:hypothetical protein
VAYGSGKAFVVWGDVREGDIYGARLKPDGTLLDPEGLRLNLLDETGREPAVAYDGKNFMVVWESSIGILGVRVKPDGTVLDPVFFVIGSDEVGAPAITCSDRKVCLVTFTVQGDRTSTIGYGRVKTDGTVLERTADPFLGTGGSRATESSVAWDGKQFLVVWSDTRGGGLTPDIYGARIAVDGTIVGDSEGFPISTAPGAQRSPDVTWTGRRFLTVWEDSREGPFRVFGARVRKDATVEDPEGFPISPAEPPFGHIDPTVAHHNSKSLVVWRGGDGLLGARVDEAGRVLDPDAFVIALESDEQFLPDVAYGGGRFFTVYGHGGTSADPFSLRGKWVQHDTDVGELIDITRSFEEFVLAPATGRE